jgi:hypothetical protein
MWQHLRKKQSCGHCGTRRDEWVGPDGGRLDTYTAEARLCHGCRAISVAREGLGEKPPAGAQIVLTKGGARGKT